MLFTIIAGMLIALAAEPNAASACASSFSPPMVMLWTLLLTVSAAVPGVVTSKLLAPELLETSEGRARALRIARTGAIVAQAWVLAAFAGVTYLVQWPLFVAGALRLEGWVLVEEMARLAPFLAMLFLAWMPAWRIDRALRPGGWSLREFLEFQVRQNLLFILLPVMVLVAAEDSLRFLPGAEWLVKKGLDAVVILALMAAMYAFAPLVLRFVWKTRRLEPGDLRARLEALESRAGIFSRDLLVWDTLGGNIPNACVIGATQRLRYVMVTDALMDVLPGDRIEAVFAHELGHVKRRHILWFVLFALSLMGALFVVNEIPFVRSHARDSVGDLLSIGGFVSLALAVPWWGLGFGWVSRRFELEADLYAVSLTSSAAFVDALECIARAGGRPRDSGGWRHFSIARRVEFLQSCEADPAYRERFERRMRRLRFALAALSAVVFVLAVRMSLISRA